MSGLRKRKEAKMPRKHRNINLEVEPAGLPRILGGSALNFLFIIIAWIAVYFAICYPITITNPGIKQARDYNDELLASLNLKLPSNSSQEEFKQAVDDFYFVEFPKQIEDLFVPEGYGLIAYYNVNIHDWHVESGDFRILVGASSRDIRLDQSVQVTSTVAAEIPDYRFRRLKMRFAVEYSDSRVPATAQVTGRQRTACSVVAAYVMDLADRNRVPAENHGGRGVYDTHDLFRREKIVRNRISYNHIC